MRILELYLNCYKYKRKFLQHFEYIRNYTTTDAGLKVLFFGADKFSLPSLKILHEEKRKSNSKISSLGVVTSFRSPANPVKIYATDNKLELYQWPLQLEKCVLNDYNLGIVVSFGHLIPKNVIAAFSLGMINVHASLLPRWRGAAPIIYSIMKGDTKTGISIMKIEPKHFDVGDVLFQSEVKINSDVLLPQLHNTLAIEGSKLLLKTVLDSPDCLRNFKKQNDNHVTYAPKILPTMAEVRWSEMTALEVYNLYRALYSYKNLYTKFNNINIKIIELNFNRNTQNGSTSQIPGSIEYSKSNNALKVYCKNGEYINILKLKVEGKKIISAQDFKNGFLKKCSVENRIFK